MSTMRSIIEASRQHSEQQLQFAEQGNWDAFHDHEPKRQQLIRSLNNVNVDVVSPDEIRLELEKLIALNDEIERLCIEHRNSLMQTLLDLRAGAKANNAYAK